MKALGPQQSNFSLVRVLKVQKILKSHPRLLYRDITGYYCADLSDKCTLLNDAVKPTGSTQQRFPVRVNWMSLIEYMQFKLRKRWCHANSWFKSERSNEFNAHGNHHNVIISGKLSWSLKFLSWGACLLADAIDASSGLTSICWNECLIIFSFAIKHAKLRVQRMIVYFKV